MIQESPADALDALKETTALSFPCTQHHPIFTTPRDEMTPRVHLVRHAEGLHNFGQEFWSLIDPPLTDKGKDQCRQLREDFPFHSNVELVVSSPLSRAIHSATEGFHPAMQSQPSQRLIPLPDPQEISDFPCDIGCDVEGLQVKMKNTGVSIDYSNVDEMWNSKEGRYKPTIEATRERARAVRQWLSMRQENEIVVVSHGAFLPFLTEDWEDSYVEEATGWENAEYRTYDMKDKCSPGLDCASCCLQDASMTETTESRRRRGKIGPAPALEEQLELHIKALQVWEQQGYLMSAADREKGAQ